MPSTNTDLPIDTGARAEVIDGLLRKLHAYYVFPEVAALVETSIRQRLSNGEYDGIITASALCDALTAARVSVKVHVTCHQVTRPLNTRC